MASLLVKSVLMWLLILVAMVANGAFRVLVLRPRLGEHSARQVASVLGVIIILGMTGPFVRRLGDPGAGRLLEVGLLWLVLTVAFELLFGHYVAGASWDVLVDDYDLLSGHLWPLVPAATLLAPWLWGVARGTATRR